MEGLSAPMAALSLPRTPSPLAVSAAGPLPAFLHVSPPQFISSQPLSISQQSQQHTGSPVSGKRRTPVPAAAMLAADADVLDALGAGPPLDGDGDAEAAEAAVAFFCHDGEALAKRPCPSHAASQGIEPERQEGEPTRCGSVHPIHAARGSIPPVVAWQGPAGAAHVLEAP